MYVGMNRDAARVGAVLMGVPHVRGDEPVQAWLDQPHVERSPCTWG